MKKILIFFFHNHQTLEIFYLYNSLIVQCLKELLPFFIKQFFFIPVTPPGGRGPFVLVSKKLPFNLLWITESFHLVESMYKNKNIYYSNQWAHNRGKQIAYIDYCHWRQLYIYIYKK
jgi:hypothetical protein